MEDLIKDHAALVVVLISALSSGLLGCLIYIFISLRDEVREVRTLLEKLTGNIFKRLNRAERSLDRLWEAHRIHMQEGGCIQPHLNFDKEDDDADESEF